MDAACQWAQHGGHVVALDFWVEKELIKRGAPYIARREFFDPGGAEEEWWLLAQDIAREWYRLPHMKYFQHSGVRIAEALEPMMEAYVSRLFYYVRIYSALKDAYPSAYLRIPSPFSQDAPTVGPLASFERWAVIDAAKMAGLKVSVLGERAVVPRRHLFPRATWKSILTRLYNSVLFFVPRRQLKIYASEYWHNIAPVISQINDTELVLMESGELQKISWRQIFKHRIRVQHPADTIRGAERREALRISKEFTKQWETAGTEVALYLAHARSELDWQPVLSAFRHLHTYSARVVADIDALRRIMEKEKPNVVLQRASIGGRQHHFFLMARVAAQLHIPTIELQHAAAYIDPRSVHSRIETDILAAYGPYTAERYASIGYAHKKIVPVGSPRFDIHHDARKRALRKGKELLEDLALDVRRPVLFVTVPFSGSIVSPIILDSFELGTFFADVRAAQSATVGLQILFKFRNNSELELARGCIHELFPADVAITCDRNLLALLCASDAALCGNSTVMYEILLSEKPLILYPWKVWDRYMKDIYARAGPVPENVTELSDILAHLFFDPQYREQLIVRGKSFLKGYAFDGKAVERTIALLRQTGF